MRYLIPLSILVIAASAFTFINSAPWNIGEDFAIEFESKNPNGSFKELEGSIVFDPFDLEHSSFDVKVPVESIATGNGLKNKHARGKNWFEADKYPYITFSSKYFEPAENGTFKVQGTLEMHGVSKEITIPFTFADNVFQGELEVNRIDFGIGSTKGMSKKVPEVMQVKLRVPVSQ